MLKISLIALVRHWNVLDLKAFVTEQVIGASGPVLVGRGIDRDSVNIGILMARKDRCSQPFLGCIGSGATPPPGVSL